MFFLRRYFNRSNIERILLKDKLRILWSVYNVFCICTIEFCGSFSGFSSLLLRKRVRSSSLIGLFCSDSDWFFSAKLASFSADSVTPLSFSNSSSFSIISAIASNSSSEPALFVRLASISSDESPWAMASFCFCSTFSKIEGSILSDISVSGFSSITVSFVLSEESV